MDGVPNSARIVAVVIAAAACEQRTPPLTAAEATAGYGIAAPQPTSHVDDAAIVRVVLRELEQDRPVAAARIGVTSRRGIVTTDGNVDNLLAKERAVAITRVVRGVRAIIDHIDLAPPLVPGRHVDFDVTAALAADPVASAFPIAVRVDGDTVHVGGDVDSMAVKRIVRDVVASVPGVRTIDDALALRPELKTSDAVRRRVVEQTIRDDPWLDDSRIDVGSVRNGTVHLSGYVGSMVEHARAVTDAQSAGARAVDASHLRVDPWTRADTLRASPQVVLKDSEIAQAVIDAFTLDMRLRGWLPTVDVHDGVVMLTGATPEASAARAAEDDAANTIGATNVQSLVKVGQVPSISDDEIRARIQRALVRDARHASESVRVVVHEGHANVGGTVSSELERDQVLRIVAATDGVVDVHDGLVVQPRTMHAAEAP
jgi:osmotically-inducible protein OsmY